ncbi:MAG: zf-HC2 domain-containing protein [bacterium]
MKQCKKVKYAQRYHDGELSAWENEMFEKHLAGCAGCKAYSEEILSISAAIGRKMPAEPPLHFAEKIIRQTVGSAPARAKEYFWETVGGLSRRFIPATLLLCCVMSVAAFLTLQSDGSAAASQNYSGSYYFYSFEKHEKAFLASEDGIAVGHLYTALKYNKTDRTTEQNGVSE